MKVTILISIHNSAETLDRTFESLLVQTTQDFVIMAIDDASTDTSRDKLRVWQEKFGRERFSLLINDVNLGLTRSLNRGLENIHTLYTARLDSDDWWEAEKLQKQIDYLDTHPDCGIVGTDYTDHLLRTQKTHILPKTDAAIRSSIIRRNPFAHSAVMFRTKLIQEAQGYDETVRYGQDYDLWLRLFPKTTYANLEGTLCHRNAIDTLSSKKQRAQMLQCVQTQLKYIKLYHLPCTQYRFILEPLLVALTPSWIRSVKRKLAL